MTPTEWEFQRLAFLRGLTEGGHFKRLEAGFEGEEKFYRLLQEFGLKHWVILRNIWFHDDSDFECDFILVTWHAVYLFEVKNYYGRFVYENGECFSRGVAITYNPVNQARNTIVHLRNVTRVFSRDVEVRGALVFIGEHNQVEIRDDIDYIDILKSNDVYQFIQEIIRREQTFGGRKINIDAFANYYAKQRIVNPYMSRPFTADEMLHARKGIYCAKCDRKVALIRDRYLKCTCGLHEPREEAIVRTACEYGVLTYGRNFTVSDIHNFIGDGLGRIYLNKLLNKYFLKIESAKIYTYGNLGRDYPIISDKFLFALPKILIY